MPQLTTNHPLAVTSLASLIAEKVIPGLEDIMLEEEKEGHSDKVGEDL